MPRILLQIGLRDVVRVSHLVPYYIAFFDSPYKAYSISKLRSHNVECKNFIDSCSFMSIK